MDRHSKKKKEFLIKKKENEEEKEVEKREKIMEGTADPKEIAF